MRLVVILLLPLDIPAFIEMSLAQLRSDNAGRCLGRRSETGVAESLAETLFGLPAAALAIDGAGEFDSDLLSYELIEQNQSFFSVQMVLDWIAVCGDQFL